MRGPEEVSSAEKTSSVNSCEDTLKIDGQDESSSPPCKRLKQAVLSFQSPPESNKTQQNSAPPTPPMCHDSKDSSSDDVVIIDDDKPQPGGLVTAAPSPPSEVQRPGSSASVSSLNDSMSSASAQSEGDNTSSCKSDTACTIPPTPSTTGSKPDVSDETSVPKTPSNKTTACSKTPKLSSAEKLKKKEEREKLKAEKQKQKDEKEKEKLEAKAAKEKERQEAKQKKEQERLEKQAEKEKKDKERLEKKQKEERERLEKKEKKEEEKRKREEEINAKLEEKRKKEEERKQQEEEQLKKKRQAKNNFMSFFIASPAPAPKTLQKKSERFQPFQVKQFMTLAPVTRSQIEEAAKDNLVLLMEKQDTTTSTYLNELSSRKPLNLVKAMRRSNQKQASETSKDEPMDVDGSNQDDGGQIVIPDDETSNQSSIVEIEQPIDAKKYMKAILLQFKENYRPAYYGTQRKRSKTISPRNPFKKDKVLLDYEVDSDEEWEEEEPGESLSNSEGEDEDEADDEEDGDGFFVPHGYLSDDEGINGEDEEGNPEAKQEQQLAKAKQWEAELKRKFKPLRPVAIGCLWSTEAGAHDLLKQFEAISLVYETSTNTNPCTESESSDVLGNSVTGSTPEGVHPTAMIVPEEAMPDLIRHAHGSTAGVLKLVKNFKEYWSNKCLPRDGNQVPEGLQGKGHISRRQLERKIQAIAVKERRYDKFRWYVHTNILEKYGLQGLEMSRNISPAPGMSNVSPPKPGAIPFVQTTKSPENRESQMEGIEESGNSVKVTASDVCASSSDVIIVDDDQPIDSAAKRRINPTLISGPENADRPAKRRIALTSVSQFGCTTPSSESQAMGNQSEVNNSPNATAKGSQTLSKRRIVPTLVSTPAAANTASSSVDVSSANVCSPTVKSSPPADAGVGGASLSLGVQQSEVPPKRRIVPTLISAPGDNKALPSVVPAPGTNKSVGGGTNGVKQEQRRRIVPTLISGLSAENPKNDQLPKTASPISESKDESPSLSKVEVPLTVGLSKPNHIAKVAPTLISAPSKISYIATSSPVDSSCRSNDGAAVSSITRNPSGSGTEGGQNPAIKRPASSPGNRAHKIARKSDVESLESSCTAPTSAELGSTSYPLSKAESLQYKDKVPAGTVMDQSENSSISSHEVQNSVFKSSASLAEVSGLDNSIECTYVIVGNSLQSPLVESGQVPKPSSVS